MKKYILFYALIFLCYFLATSIVSAQVSAPTNVTATVAFFSKITLDWEAPSGDVSSYKVYRNGAVVTTVNLDSYLFPLITLPGNQYCFTVTAVGADGVESSPSNEVCASIVRGTAVTPTEFTATAISSNSVALKWKYSLTQQQLDALDEIDGYMAKSFIERSLDGGSTWTILGQASAGSFFPGDTFEVTYTDTSAVSGSSNSYRVTGLEESGGGFSQPSATVTVTPGQAQEPPQSPSNLTVTYLSDPTSVSLRWTDNSNDETAFSVEKSTGDTWTELSRYSHSNSSTQVTHIVSGLSLGTTYTIRARAVNTIGMSEPSNTTTIVTTPAINTSPINASVLCVYNSTVQMSKDICDYYLQKRPGAQSKGLDIPDSAFHRGGEEATAVLREDMTQTNFTQYVLNPLRAHIVEFNASHPSAQITHLAIAKGLPIRTNVLAVQPFNPRSANQTLNDHFSREGIVSSFLSGFTLADIKKMIDKAQETAPDLSSVKWVLDLDNDVSMLGDMDSYIARGKLMSYGISEQNVIIELSNANPLVLSGTVVAYGGLGTHHNQNAQANTGASAPYGYPPEWAYNTVRMPVANRAIVDAYESFYAVSFHDRPQGQGLIAQAMVPHAFGGSNYSRSFSAGVGTVYEPGGGGLVPFVSIFSEYLKGHTLAQSFKNVTSSGAYPMAMVAGDPLMTIRDGGSLLTSRTNVKPTIFAGADISVPGPTAQLNATLMDEGYPESGATLTWSKQSGPGTATFSKRISAFSGDRSVLSSAATFSSPGAYVVRITASNGPTSAYDELTVTVTAGADTAAPVIQTVSPTGTLSSNTTNTTLSITTDENATCKYSTTANTAFSSSGNTAFTTTGAKSHSTTIQNLSRKTSYRYYVRCQDVSSNVNTIDHQILFAVADEIAPEVDTTKPSVSVTYPSSGSVIYEGPIVVTASASDLVGVAGVKFYMDNQMIGQEDTSSPYSVTVNISKGNHRIYAVARDARGNTETSSNIAFEVRERPVVVDVPVIPNRYNETPRNNQPTTITTIPTTIPVVNEPSTRYTYEGIAEMVYMKDPDSKIVDGQIVEDDSNSKNTDKGVVSSVASFVVRVVDSFVDFITGLFK